MNIELTADDIALMRAEIRRFCQQTIRPLVARPERVIDPTQLDQLTRQAEEIGLLHLDMEPGAGLWEDPNTPGWTQFSSAALQLVARANAGIAFHFQQLALGCYVKRNLGLASASPSIVCLQGSYGLARYSLARFLKGIELTDPDRAMLEDYFLSLGQNCSQVPILFQAAEPWQDLVVPCQTEDHHFGWALFDREELEVTQLPHSHGLDELCSWEFCYRGEKPKALIADSNAAPLYAKALNLHAQALMAIALGTVQEAYDKAAEYAMLRKQGGKPISDHAAVRLLLARCAGTVRSAELVLEQLATLPVAPDRLGIVLAVRSQMHASFCAAANDALQVFGGSGYTCEVGLEKIVRDCNHLRLLCGTPDELMLFVSEWEKN